MKLTHTTGRDYKGHPVPVYVFDCTKDDKDVPKLAKFMFGLHGGIREPADKWTTADPNHAKKLIQYADDLALAALVKDGVGDVEKARKNAVKREKAQTRKEINELTEMTDEERQKQIHRYLGFAEKDAREQGYVSANCTNRLVKLGAFQDPQIKERYEAAKQVARLVTARKRALDNLEWIGQKIPGYWYMKGETVVSESVHLLRQAGDVIRADELERRLNLLRARFKQSRIVVVEQRKELPYTLKRGSGYGFEPFVPGSLLRNTPENITRGEPEWLVVVRAGQKYHAEGEKHGVGASRGYIYWADCRAASEKEREPGESAWKEAQVWQETQDWAQREWDHLAKEVVNRGAYPPGHQRPRGEVIRKPHADHSEYFLVNSHEIWFLRENNHLCNVLHEDVPAAGHRIHFCTEINKRLRTAVTAMLVVRPPILGKIDFNENSSYRIEPLPVFAM
jgi:hypothetical protein